MFSPQESLLSLLDFVGDLEQREIQLDRRLPRLRGEVVADEARELVSCPREQIRLLRRASLLGLYRLHVADHRPHLRVGLYDGQSCSRRLRTLQHGCKHVESSLCEGVRKVF